MTLGHRVLNLSMRLLRIKHILRKAICQHNYNQRPAEIINGLRLLRYGKAVAIAGMSAMEKMRLRRHA
jgi:hypothetical protein